MAAPLEIGSSAAAPWEIDSSDDDEVTNVSQQELIVIDDDSDQEGGSSSGGSPLVGLPQIVSSSGPAPTTDGLPRMNRKKALIYLGLRASRIAPNKDTIKVRVLALRKALQKNAMTGDTVDRHLQNLEAAELSLSDTFCDDSVSIGDFCFVRERTSWGFWPGKVLADLGEGRLRVGYIGKCLGYDKDAELWEGEFGPKFISFSDGWLIAGVEPVYDCDIEKRRECIRETTDMYLAELGCDPMPHVESETWASFVERAHATIVQAEHIMPLQSHMKDPSALRRIEDGIIAELNEETKKDKSKTPEVKQEPSKKKSKKGKERATAEDLEDDEHMSNEKPKKSAKRTVKQEAQRKRGTKGKERATVEDFETTESDHGNTDSDDGNSVSSGKKKVSCKRKRFPLAASSELTQPRRAMRSRRIVFDAAGNAMQVAEVGSDLVLLAAFRDGDVETARKCVNNEEVDCLARAKNTNDSIIHLAVELDNVELVQLAIDGMTASHQRLGIAGEFDIDLVVERYGYTALHLAMRNHRNKVIPLLLAHTRDPNRLDKNRNNALAQGVTKADSVEAQLLSTKLMLDWDAGVTTDSNGGSSSLGGGSSSSVPLKLREGVLPLDKNNKDKYQLNALRWAILEKFFELAALLTEHGCHVDCLDDESLEEDFSQGAERFPIPLDTRDADGNLRIPLFAYIPKSIGNNPDPKCVGCNCEKGQCRFKPEACSCCRSNSLIKLPYDPQWPPPRVPLEASFRTECSEKCREPCDPGELMRLTQAGIGVKVKITWDEWKGFCVVLREGVGRGQFIGTYAGRVYEPAELERAKEEIEDFGCANGMNYLVEVHGTGFDYGVDASKVGNCSRLINHSCRANLKLMKINHGNKYPTLAFFAKESLDAGTELTWNYRLGGKKVKGMSKDCNCGEPGCQGKLM